MKIACDRQRENPSVTWDDVKSRMIKKGGQGIYFNIFLLLLLTFFLMSTDKRRIAGFCSVRATMLFLSMLGESCAACLTLSRKGQGYNIIIKR